MTSTVPPHLLFTDENHWRVGWGEGLYNFEEQDLPLWMSFGSSRYEPKTFDLEMRAAARRIADRATKPIYVAMSGGIDSELVARAMLEEKVPFTPLIGQFDNDYNKHDIAYAFEFSQKNNLTPEVMKVDILALFKDSANTPYVLTNVAHLLQMQLMRHAASLGGLGVIACGESRYEVDSKNGGVFMPVSIHRVAKMHFMQAEKVEAVPVFYCYTPELMLSFLREARAQGFEKLEQYAHNIKENVYRKFWPDLTPRPKYSGMEDVGEARRAAQRILYDRVAARYKYKKFRYFMPLAKLEQQLSPKPEIQTT